MNESLYTVGDLVRLVASTGAAQAGEEGRVCRVESDAAGNVVALDILLDGDPARIRGTTVFANEVEHITPPSQVS